MDKFNKYSDILFALGFVLMLGLAAVAEPLLITLIGEKWRTSIEYLQLLCFVGIFYPLHALNLNMLKVKGRSDLFLKLEIIKKIIAIPTIILGVFFGIKIMILGMIFNSLFAYYLNSYWSGRLIGYPIREQIADILPSFLLALSVSLAVFFIGWILPTGYFIKFIVQVLAGGLLVVSISELLQMDSYMEMKAIIALHYNKLRNGRK